MSEEKTVMHCNLLMQLEVTVCQMASSRKASRHRTVHAGKWGGNSWSEQRE